MLTREKTPSFGALIRTVQLPPPDQPYTRYPVCIRPRRSLHASFIYSIPTYRFHILSLGDFESVFVLRPNGSPEKAVLL